MRGEAAWAIAQHSQAKAGLEPLHVYLDEMDRLCDRQPAGG